MLLGGAEMIFTFHYVSINISSKSSILSFFLVFTFHYVSINIRQNQAETVRYLSLHSTMYLLIYVPPVTKLLFSVFFTFHYVSININEQKSLLLAPSTLHSTMYLLIWDYVDGFRDVFLPLHSTMYLLI